MTDTIKTQFAGSTLRFFLEHLAETKRLDPVLARMSAPAQTICRKPVLPTSWVDGAVMAELCEALADIAGEQAIRDMTYLTTKNRYTPMVNRLVEAVLALFGTSPATLFGRMDSIMGNFERGMTWGYAPTGPNEGLIQLELTETFSERLFAAWEGIFQVAFDMTRKKGTVARRKVYPDGRGATWQVSWT